MNGSIGDSSQNEKSNSVSCVLIVENLVRPFTLPGLKKILSKFGKIDDEKFWINKDKSKCYVVYENDNIAEQSKEYINNLKWPASNPNTLNSEFGKLEILEELLKKQEEEKIQLEKEKKEAAALAAAKAEEERERRANLEEEALKSKNGENNCSEENLNDSSTREKTPPKQDVTNVVHVTNLVRPFKIAQLKDLLNKFGPIIEEKFWIDKIKSNCYAVYESNDIACESRNYIHGLNWPSSNSKTLKADFAKLNDVNELLNPVVQKNIVEETKSNDEIKIDKKLSDENKDVKPLKNEIKKDVVKEKSPAKNPVTNILFVKNLSRPFTMLQLKDLLSKDGEFNQEKFWIDKIKSKCYVTYENEEVALKTRERIHDLTWPNGNQRQLQADFATENELEEILHQDRPYLDRQPLPPQRNYQYSERERFSNYEQEKRHFRPERSDRMRRRSPVRKSRSKSVSHSVSRSRSSSSSSSSSFDSSKSRSVSKNKRTYVLTNLHKLV
ncbi:hypothetical protein RND71_043499 [Anisodus tanguticus]|uniref:RRM domain-containing protein n=1 Tax=Anisodus tanguticus TaxID=243964 RepID=A0AAE1UMG5_9SOLA|nr:hypothetical protein RND71_043499 [Anisodus tanguticus]